MADRCSINPGIRLDIQQLQSEAQHRWLRPAEVCEILRNFQSFQISSEPPTRPPSGSLFLYDRKVLRYFRKDGHNWRKKKDGKTVKEAHEKLKVGSIDMLHCYYAHGEDNENFQRRCYWLLEEEYMHIVFVHYLEVKGSRSYNRDAETRMLSSPMSTSLASSYSNNQSESFAANAGSPSATSSLTSAFEEVESDEYKGSILLASGLAYNSNDHQQESEGPGAANPGTIDLATWEEVFEQYTGNLEAGNAYSLCPLTKLSGLGTEYGKLSELIDDDLTINFGPGGSSVSETWQKNNPLGISEFQSEASLDEASKYHSNPKQPLLGSLRASESLQKVDSFSKWMSKELGEAGELQLESSSSISWCNIESENAADDSSINHELHLGSYSLSPSISQDQLFSIIDIIPNWCYTDSATEVIINGKFLKSQQEKVILSCMFGEVEVSAKILKDGSGLICCAPEHCLGRVPFYVTCSNRLACSEVRDFEYRLNPESVLLHRRLDKLLSISSAGNQVSNIDNLCEKLDMIRGITSIMESEQSPKVLEVESEDGKSLKEKLYAWLLDKVNEDGKGPNILDDEGQGVIHLAGALGYDWVIQPTLAAGVNINFRDMNGWTALHWAAFHGREKTVALLVLLGAASGALSDPSPEFPHGRTAADLASMNGFKGISGFLAESLLTNHLATLQMSDQKLDQSREPSSIYESIQTIADRTATPGFESDSDAAEALSMKDSLAAVLNATQAHGRIHQVFRMRSFQRKKMNELEEDDASGITNQRIVSLIPSRMQRSGNSEDHHVHSAAVQIQKKFRGWKRRREFLIIRQRVVKIQAHVRGHQARKRYKPVIWSVGILEKVILRWRRKGTGLRGFRSSAQQQQPVNIESSPQALPPKVDDDDYLKEGRKQAEDRLQKALVRVKSMVQYPDARAQYRRLLTTVENMQKNQGGTSNTDNPEGTSQDGEDAMIDVERLFDDDNFMAMAFD